MDFIDTPDQAALRSSVRDFLAAHTGGDDTTWKRLGSELGLAALTVPEALGGAGATFAEAAVVIEECGRTLSPLPYLPTVVVATVLAELGHSLADDTQRAAIVLEDLVLHGDSADSYLVAANGTLRLLNRADVDVAPLHSLDQTRPLARVSVPSGAGVELGADTGRARDLLWTALAVESVAAAERILEITVEYLKTRVQFGKTIGSFQALKHQAADLVVAIEAAKSLAKAASWAAANDPAALPLLAPMAKLKAADAFWFTASESIQLHGGIGFTWEHQAHLYFKRAKSTQLLNGNPGELRSIIGARAGILEGSTHV